jgi:hypothetical protein
MLRVLASLVIAVMLCSVACSQESAGALAVRQSEEAFWTSIDAGTEGGKWLIEVFKPYADQLTQAVITTQLSEKRADQTGLSEEEIAKNVKAGNEEYSAALQDITPPEELKAYHAKIREVYAEIAKLPPYDQQTPESTAAITKLGLEARDEIVRVFALHNVPKEVVDQFANLPQ